MIAPAHEVALMVGKVPIDSGMVVVVFISLMYLSLVFGLLFYVQNDWCDLLFKNFTVRIDSINTQGLISLDHTRYEWMTPELNLNIHWGQLWETEMR